MKRDLDRCIPVAELVILAHLIVESGILHDVEMGEHIVLMKRDLDRCIPGVELVILARLNVESGIMLDVKIGDGSATSDLL
ncbi:hypothetical protein BGZ72_006724 [Mortierella alpina]|nr:hypothetical protein BGZ72_006724 [Mortierella alpina]